MKSKFKWILVGSLAFLVQVGFAQEKTFNGIVSEGGLPLPGVSVTISGTSEGTQTDLDGKYSLKVKKGDVIIFSFVGMKDIKHTVGGEAVYNVTMASDEEMLDEVVVTALGIKRDKKKLGYSSQEVKGDNLSGSGQTNAVNALSGNVAGLQVTSPSSMGGSARIVLRGVKSVTGNNQPLIVVDGVPLDNSNFADSNMQRGAGGRDYGDTSADINPDDIESVTVLKGGPASALYGNRGGNGVIIYTTKSAKNGRTDIEFNTGLSFESINIMPKLQTLYGGGSASKLPTAVIGGKTYNIAEYKVDESWGPKFDGTPYLPWYAFDPEFADDYMKEVPWQKAKNDVKSFFDTGITHSQSVSVGKSFKESNVRMSFSNNVTEGVVPNSKLQRNNFSVNASTQLTDKLKAETNFNYVYTKGFNRPEVGYGDNSVAQKFFQWGQRQVDFKKLKDYKLANGDQRSWNRNAWDDGTPAYSDNPYWVVNENTSQDVRNRMYGNVKLTYNITDKIYAVGTVYGDRYSFTVEERVAKGSQATSKYSIMKRDVSEYNYEGRVHYDDHFGDFGLNAFVGVNRSEKRRDYVYGTTVGGLDLPNLYNLSNSVSDAKASNEKFHSRTNSVFGSVSLNYKEFLFLEGTMRTDWFSTVKKSVTYPSVTGTFIFSQLLPEVDWLSFGKVRLGWAQVGNDTEAYRTADYYNLDGPFNGSPTYSLSATANNPDLKPEMMTTKEIGLEAGFLNNRVGFEVSYYQIDTKDLITRVQYDAASGFAYQWQNAGDMKNKGIEATVNLAPVRTDDFSWDITWNFSKNKNELTRLADGVKSVEITRAPFQVSLQGQVGETYGQIYGTDFVYDDHGNKVVGADGLYQKTGIQALGSYLPDYNMGLRNSFKYKNFSLGVLIDMQKGGKYFSTSHMFGMYTGMLDKSAENGVRENGIILDGVKEDGTKNDKVVSGQKWAQSHYGGVDAQNVFNSDYIKLREISLGYDLPTKWIGPFKGITISAYGRNLFTWNLDWKGMDPEMASYGSGNIQAIEGASLPSTRTYGMNVKFKF
ncbi:MULTISPECIES: SusC/RagA family TonB-linked outer membrane protein [Myroides]|uniref:SusC/RagA family TonB-linked outer membrane protein n=2 Tax=Myroides odoratimimus TaxID=76832 RepID=A0A0S7EDK8_9FLAO|nr:MULTISPECIES: SusC/RagA family TonB-linked outer membrane protein [Myroides]ALU25187.1 SusC/RagA family TonB-linked outer membrane protein [Myroides odoratimimus]EHO07378.1 SusC/RagA family TonB-linked outer membrane protein [Myroides odoratimimus CCUG 10230]MCS7472629.1 SusC/RagA family TonB-linked outer membrane protein [Myroides odoratimimus]MDM1034106.1 SusC/RagA family TonB-linked outer membrane protein [Myroides odoratimimus]MDM1037411.1 SusC/RagA family TonB-linked outer membrane pro